MTTFVQHTPTTGFRALSGFLRARLMTDFIYVWAEVACQAIVVKMAAILPGNLFLYMFSIASLRQVGPLLAISS